MMSKKLLSVMLLIFPVFLARIVSAHCPLCTVGAGAAAAGAVWLGVSKVVVALFIGAFAMSMGMWFARIIEKRKKFIPFQGPLIIISIFLLTILPLMPIIKAYGPLSVQLIGDYGSLLNRTYMLDYSLVSSLFGGIITFVSPKINKKIREKRNGKGIPFQGILLTFLLLGIAAAIIQFTV
ncbi:hypothetical protein BMS3Abin17_00961 [archaeon BMS3Abin17]|nr:hypothetical protein BMS3Abin17_00961 [archaeon BMS3Abin17]HDZ60336.1 hypothetical protein [Candidatus Pacearchaeota archaeon]